jgi:hypothetical protein
VGPGTDPCGQPLDGIWFQIDYDGAYTSTNPDWTFSPTPGWGEAQWAYQGDSWPEVWDLYNNINIVADHIGDAAAIGPSGVLQIMIGLGDLISYDHATVCVEGRSYSTSSSVIFDVYNPWNGCGASATMGNDWTVHAVSLDLGSCYIAGNNTQAVRVDPSGGSSALNLTRLTFVLHGAVY